MNKTKKNFLLTNLLYFIICVVASVFAMIILSDIYSKPYSVNVKVKNTIESIIGEPENAPVFVFPDFPDEFQQFNGKSNNYIMKDDKIIVPLVFMPDLKYSEDFVKKLFGTTFYDFDTNKIKTYHKIYQYDNLEDMNNFKENILQDIDNILNSNINNEYIIKKNTLEEIKKNVSYSSFSNSLYFKNPNQMVHFNLLLPLLFLFGMLFVVPIRIKIYFDLKKVNWDYDKLN